MARCSFDIHVKDIIGSLIVGASLVMLHPDGNMDFEYLAGVLKQKQIAYMQVVPTLLQSLFQFLKEKSLVSALEWLRSVCSSGESSVE
jgi:non-ribosomal peptide synthetase component F